MSDSDDHGPDVDDMLEAAYGGGNEKESSVSRDGKAESTSRKLKVSPRSVELPCAAECCMMPL
jgi:hypothetical protein